MRVSRLSNGHSKFRQRYLVLGGRKDATRTSPQRPPSQSLIHRLWSYSDGVGGRTLSSATYQSGTAMTAQACIAFCDRQSYNYAGAEYSGECCEHNRTIVLDEL